MISISVQQLMKSFGDVRALAGVDLEIAEGEFYGLLGPNGAGKTTLLRIVCGLLRADGGTVAVAGTDITHTKPAATLGVVPQELALYEMLSARENLELFGAMYDLRGAALRQRAAELLEFVGLADRARAKVGTFSGGMKRRLNLAVGLVHDPLVLLLDEPTVGVDPQSRASIFSLLETLNRSGKTIIYTTHYMEEAERLCRRIGIIDHGRLLVEGTLTELLSQVKASHTVRVHGAVSSWPVLPEATLAQQEGYADYVPRQSAPLGNVVTALERSGARFERMEIRGPNLETLFLQLTGKELRD